MTRQPVAEPLWYNAVSAVVVTRSSPLKQVTTRADARVERILTYARFALTVRDIMNDVTPQPPPPAAAVTPGAKYPPLATGTSDTSTIPPKPPVPASAETPPAPPAPAPAPTAPPAPAAAPVPTAPPAPAATPVPTAAPAEQVVTGLPSAIETVAPAPAIPTAPPTSAGGATVVNEQGQRVPMAQYLAEARDRQAATMGRKPAAPAMTADDQQQLTNLRTIRDKGLPAGVSMRHSYAPGGGRTTTLTGANGAPLPPAQMALMQSMIDQQRSSGSNSIWGDPTLKLAQPAAAPQKLYEGMDFTDAELPKLLPGFRPGERPDVVKPYLEQLQARTDEARTLGDEFLPHAMRTNPGIANSRGFSTPGAEYSKSAPLAAASGAKRPNWLSRMFGKGRTKSASAFAPLPGLWKVAAPEPVTPITATAQPTPAAPAQPAPTAPAAQPAPTAPAAQPAAAAPAQPANVPMLAGVGDAAQSISTAAPAPAAPAPTTSSAWPGIGLWDWAQKNINPDPNYAFATRQQTGVSPPPMGYALDPQAPRNMADAAGDPYNPAGATQLPTGPKGYARGVPDNLLKGPQGLLWQTLLGKLGELQGQGIAPRGGSMFSAATAPASQGVWAGPPRQAAPYMYGNVIPTMDGGIPPALQQALQGLAG